MLPLSKVSKFLDDIGKLENCPFEIHFINQKPKGKVMIRFYIEGKSNDWLDTLTSKVQYYKGSLRSHKFTMMRADENLIS